MLMESVIRSSYDLPPSSVAKPLSVRDPKQKPVGSKKESTKKKASVTRPSSKGWAAKDDDTPRAFARLMQFQTTGKRIPAGLDDGIDGRKKKKQSRRDSDVDPLVIAKEDVATRTLKEEQMPKILPGERMSDFAARVDQALPVAGLKGKPGRGHAMSKERQTRLERKMQKMQKGWREEDMRRKEKREEESDDELEGTTETTEVPAEWGSTRKGKKRTVDDDDPWAGVNAVRTGKQRDLQDVVQAPPQLKRIKDKFKTHYGARVDVVDVPGTAGSLRKREELATMRRSVVEGYRRMMAAQKNRKVAT